MTESGVGLVSRFEPRVDGTLSPAQAEAVAEFHRRTANQFSRVRDLALIGHYAQLKGWVHIAQALTHQPAEAI